MDAREVELVPWEVEDYIERRRKKMYYAQKAKMREE